MAKPAQLQWINTENLKIFEDFVAELVATDKTPAFSEQTLVEVRRSTGQKKNRPISAWVSQNGLIVGIAVALRACGNKPGTIEGAVLPAYRGQGLGRKLSNALYRGLVDNGAAGTYHLWQHQILGAGRTQQEAAVATLAESYGLEVTRELRKLRLRLTETNRARIIQAAAAVSIPSDIEISPFVPGDDEAAWVALNAAAFANHPEQGSLTLNDLTERTESDWFRPEGFFLARTHDNLAGYHWTKIPVNQTEEGEVYAVGVSPSWQGHGLGRALTLTGMAYLAQAEVGSKKLEKIVLYVDAENTAAVALYESLGFEAETIDLMYTGILKETVDTPRKDTHEH